MVWFNLKINNWNLKYTGLNPIEKEFENCDKDGNVLKKVTGKFEKGFFLNEKSGEKHIKSLKLINGKPFDKLQKTKEIKVFKEVDLREIEDLLQEKVYLCECDGLLEDLNNSGKALKFGFTNGNGFKVFKAYLLPSKIYRGYLFMVLGTTQISELIREIDGIKQQKKKIDEISLTIQGIDRCQVEDLIQI